eukprot:19718-Chlamydomonas_euryale.AAC.3
MLSERRAHIGRRLRMRRRRTRLRSFALSQPPLPPHALPLAPSDTRARPRRASPNTLPPVIVAYIAATANSWSFAWSTRRLPQRPSEAPLSGQLQALWACELSPRLLRAHKCCVPTSAGATHQKTRDSTSQPGFGAQAAARWGGTERRL